ncbi:MAG: penicillin-binding protein activator [Alphaproteobacteria bacterium]|nr:penicillin-binding protein activator [Alphaproteobacteria bacterium]
MAGLALLISGCADGGNLANPFGGPQARPPIASGPQPVQPLLAPAPALPPPVQTPPAPPPQVTLTPPPGMDLPVVAILLPLSGRDAALGQQMLEAAELALFDAADERFTLLPVDTGGTPGGAVSAAEKAIGQGARLILGPLFGAEAAAVGPIARAAGVNVITFSNDQSVAGDNVFVFGFLPRPQVERVIAYAASKGGSRRFAVLAPRGGFGDTVTDELQKAARANRAQVTRSETYDPGTTDIAPTLRRLADFERRSLALANEKKQYEGKTDEVSRQALRRLEGLQGQGDLGFDALLLPEGGDRLRTVAPLLTSYDVDPKNVRILGTVLWDDPTLANEPALRGAWFVAPPPEARADFEAAYEKTYQRRPPRLATLAYDLVALAAILAKLDARPDFSRQALTQATGFAGVDGLFRFLPDGRSERGYAVIEIGDRQRRVVDPAPESFSGPLTN